MFHFQHTQKERAEKTRLVMITSEHKSHFCYEKIMTVQFIGNSRHASSINTKLMKSNAKIVFK